MECAESGVQRKVNFLSVHQLSMANQPPGWLGGWGAGARPAGPGAGLAGSGASVAGSGASLAGSGSGPSGVMEGLHEMLLGDRADGVSKKKGVEDPGTEKPPDPEPSSGPASGAIQGLSNPTDVCDRYRTSSSSPYLSRCRCVVFPRVLWTGYLHCYVGKWYRKG